MLQKTNQTTNPKNAPTPEHNQQEWPITDISPDDDVGVKPPPGSPGKPGRAPTDEQRALLHALRAGT